MCFEVNFLNKKKGLAVPCYTGTVCLLVVFEHSEVKHY